MSWFKSKIKMVAARAQDALAQAADIVAPTLYESPVDEFHHRWTTVSRFLDAVLNRELDPQEQRRQLLDSHTRDSLQKLVLLIYAEENKTDREELTRQLNGTDAAELRRSSVTEESPRACLEYLLERQIIPHLCDVGRRDQPCGIMSLSMQFITALLSRVNYPILPTREVHVSVVALLQAATKREVDDPVVRKCLVNLLNVLWKKLRGDPVQMEFFFLQADRNSNGSDISDLVLFTGLLPHMYATGKVGEKSREALVIAASMHEPTLCRFILKLTPFCHYAVNGVISAFDALPRTLADKPTRHAIESELQYLAVRLRFCCTLAMVGQFELESSDGDAVGMQSRPSVSSEILAQFRSRFLDGPLMEGLMHTSEATARTATLYARIILEELAACGSNTSANPLLLIFVQFLVQQSENQQSEESHDNGIERRLPMELMHRMDSLSSSLSIVTMDLFTSLLELQDDFVDRSLLGVAGSECRPSSLSSPRSSTESAIWLASRFPESAVAANAHIWKIQAFDSMATTVEIPVSSPTETESSEDQIVSLLSYIADAEYASCKRAPAIADEDWDSNDEDGTSTTNGDTDSAKSPRSSSETNKQNRRDSSSSSRTAAARNAVKPLREITLSISIPSYSPAPAKVTNRSFESTGISSQEEAPLFIRLVLNRLERVLESSFYESLALSGLISTLAQKKQCASFIFDVEEVLKTGESVRSVLEEVHADAIRRTSRLTNGHARLAETRRKLVEENNEASLNDHEPETRLLCGYVVVEEILKELCSILFAKERVKSLPVKPEGYYFEPKRASTTSTATTALESTLGDDLGGASVGSAPMSIGQEFEQLIADAESTMGSLLSSVSLKEPVPADSPATADAAALTPESA